nr:trypsin 3A1-like isoform X1 [Osmia lignaria]
MLLLFLLLCSFQAFIQPVDVILSNELKRSRKILSTKSVAARIVGGEVTDIRKYPFLVSVQRRHISHTCGGTYIAPRFVLSAAHCMVRPASRGKWVPENPHRFYVIAGATYVYFPAWSSIQLELIDGIFPHRDFQFTGMNHDIGLFRLRKALLINSFVKYATLPPAYDANIFQSYTASCTVVGWGVSMPGSNRGYGTYLRHVNVSLIPSDKCLVEGLNTEQHLCAGWLEGGRDACQGDSGGPLLCNGTQIGIVSWGKGCARPNFPGVYARLDLYLDWLNETMQRNIACQRNILDVIVILTAVISSTL